MKVRKANGKDIENLLYIEKNCGHPLPKYSITREQFLKILKEGIVFIAENGKPIGYIAMNQYFRDGCELYAICVLKECQGKGIGTKLLNRVVNEAKRLGKKKLYSYCWQKNFPSIRFHNKNKFHIIELTNKKYSGGEVALLFYKEFEQVKK